MSGVSSWAARLGYVALIAFVGGPLLANIQLLGALQGFMLFALGGLLGVLTLVLGLIGLARQGLAAARTGLLIGGIQTIIFLMAAAPGRAVPRINDITTDFGSPPQFVHAGTLDANRGRDLSYPGESFAAQQREGYPGLAPLKLPDSPDEVFKRVEAAAQKRDTWEVTRVDPTAHVLEGVATSRLFRFRDDFVIEVRPQDGGSLVQMRSKSRDGKGDVGANAARIEAFFAELK